MLRIWTEADWEVDMLNGSRRFLGCMALLQAMFLAGCASQRVDWDYDTSATVQQQMASWKTYAWVVEDEDKTLPYHYEGLQDRRIRAAVNRDLQAKGFSLVNESDADFLVNYLTDTRTRREENHVSTSLGYGVNHWGVGMQTETRVRDYDEGSLMVDFVSPQTNELVWRGRSQARISDRSTPEQRTKQIDKAVLAILKGFPPATGN